MEELPRELIGVIMGELDWHSILRLSQVSRNLRTKVRIECKYLVKAPPSLQPVASSKISPVEVAEIVEIWYQCFRKQDAYDSLRPISNGYYTIPRADPYGQPQKEIARREYMCAFHGIYSGPNPRDCYLELPGERYGLVTSRKDYATYYTFSTISRNILAAIVQWVFVPAVRDLKNAEIHDIQLNCTILSLTPPVRPKMHLL
jgi:hypothetical protein